MLSVKLALICVLACIHCLSSSPPLAKAELACRDEEGNAVDWFIAYKFPRLSGDAQFETGHAYAYFTSDDVKAEGDETSIRVADVDDPESSIFLHRFKDLLVRFAGGFAPKPKKTIKSGRKSKKANGNSSDKLTWTVSEQLISDPSSAVMRTLAPAYMAGGGKISTVFYNDDPSGTDSELSDEEDSKSSNSRRAHAKGTLMFDESTNDGVWITHSIPRFPTVRSQPLEYPASGRNNGQTLMCISFDLQKSANQIVNHLYNMRPLVYDREVSASLERRFPNLKYLDVEEQIKGKRLPTQPTLAQMITTKEGQVINLFSKSLAFGEDLWDDFVDEQLDADLYVQTWRRGGGGVLDSSCPANHHHVNNVNDMAYNSKLEWSYIKDHSKWAISDEEKLGTVCIGDMNRMASQAKRGGGAVCLKCPSCWSVFSDTIKGLEACPKGARKSKAQPVDAELVEKIKGTLNL